MAFVEQNLVRTAAGVFSNDQVPANYKYNGLEAGDATAAILGASYFDDADHLIAVGSQLDFTATDNSLVLCKVTAISPAVVLEQIGETLPPGSVDTADLADGCVTAPKLAAEAVVTSKLIDGAVAGDKIAALGVIAGKYAAVSIATADIAVGAVTTPVLADSAVVSDKIGALGVTAGKYAAGSISTDDIAASAITGTLINNGSVTSAKIANGTLQAVDLSDDIGYMALEHSGAATAATSTAFTVTGTAATDIAFATMTAGFSQPVTGVVCTADTVTVHYAAAALVTDTVSIAVLRRPS